MTTTEKAKTKEFFRQYHLWVLLVIGCALAAWIVAHKQERTVLGSKIDPFSGPLVIDAPGCEINGPAGRSIKDDIRGSAQLMIPKGSTLTGDCFPAAKAAREIIDGQDHR